WPQSVPKDVFYWVDSYCAYNTRHTRLKKQAGNTQIEEFCLTPRLESVQQDCLARMALIMGCC
ncbi:MAG: hypothetical protein ABSF10_06560, partial [Verrucomicrobiota bacterium]